MVNGRLKERPGAHKFLSDAADRLHSPTRQSGPGDKKFSSRKEYKDKTYLFLIIRYPFMSTNPDAKHN
jgi:hypothetical protein